MRGSVFKMACNERPRGMFVKGGSRTAGITAHRVNSSVQQAGQIS